MSLEGTTALANLATRVALSNCGTGAGGFKSGNTCAKGGEGGTNTAVGGSANLRDKPGTKALRQRFRKAMDAADDALPEESQRAVTSFVAHAPKGRDAADETRLPIMDAGGIEDAASDKPAPRGEVIRKQLAEAFAPVASELRAEYGETIPAYRHQGDVAGDASDRNALSWTLDPRVAESFADVTPVKPWTKAEIDDAVAAFGKDGEVTVRGKRYVDKGEDGIDVFNTADEYGGEEFSHTDGDGRTPNKDVLRETLNDRKASIDEIEADNAGKRARIVRAEIPVEDVLWATDRANQVELIVKNKGGHKLPRTATGGTHKMSKNAYYLSSPKPTADILPVDAPAKLPTQIQVKVGDETRSVPVAYFWKDAIATGEYVHPATKQRLRVDAKRLDNLAATFHRMRQAGVDIPAPKDHSARAEDNLGFVVDAKRNGDRLSLLHQVIGEDAAMIALRNRCSLCIDPNYTDEKGVQWGDALVHSAFTPNPVITGMGEFVPFAASRDRQEGVPIFYLSAGEDDAMDLQALRNALGAPATVADDKLIDYAQTLRTEKTAADEKVATLSRKPAPPDPEALIDRRDLACQRIDLAIERGDMPVTIADKLKAKLGEADKPSPFMLSRNDDLGTRPVDFVLGLFDGAKLGGVEAGEVTPANSVLPRVVPGANAGGRTNLSKGGNGDAMTPEREAELLALTSVGREVLDSRRN